MVAANKMLSPQLPEELSSTWQQRFAFYAQYGSPFSPPALEAYKELPPGDRLSVGFNLWGFIFGILYYVYLGITKRGIGMMTISAVLMLLLISADASDWWLKVHMIATQATFGGMANYYYFIRVTQGRDEWDPLKDVRRF